ncbi:long-chain-fatty-acid--CoA ligase [Sporolactobacillus sp. THM19-2]|uniref:long-chain-fatty-acid--CoA ligase n=1 Tax=Sporolactobacillus sp. THM19-2 TaxID=2511171 RepID=UPI00101F8436|nr:long-chain-fatty-acid--CoA ligase [Sporolactobacillus sp. THM19-2]RYL94463.1 long-chain-fatty-acid--CoA ligase [Sporolactobacillus sp. THM19-2]
MKHHLFIPDLLERAVKYYPDKTAVIDGDVRLTYRQFQKRVNRLSNMLTALGVKKGDRIAYLAPNTLQMLEGMFGVMQIGAVTVPLNTRLIPADYAYILNHSGARILITDGDLVHLVDPVKKDLEFVEHFLLLPSPERDEKEGWTSYEPFLNRFSDERPEIPEMDELDLSCILYTSGTTGRPKGVMHSHRSLFFNVLNSIIHLRVSDDDVLLHTLPLFHVNAWGTPFTFTGMGATHVMIRKIDPAHIFNLVRKEKVSVACMAPTVLNMLIHDPKAKEAGRGQKVRVIIAGSAPPPSFVKHVEEFLKWEFIQVYGMTEAAPFLTVSQVKSHIDQDDVSRWRIKAKAGMAMLNMDIRVVDEQGRDIATDGLQIGEIVARGNSVMEGYWRQPDETDKVLKNGWYHTGDMATIDEEGYIEIVDRKKDIIISGGENISSIEVEGVLYRHPAILEVAVIAVPHEKWGEVPHAICVLKESAGAGEEELISFCKGLLPSFKVPKSFSFVRELPKNASGKVQKVKLREPFWAGKSKKVN